MEQMEPSKKQKAPESAKVADKTYTKAEVTEILKRQIKECSESIESSNLSRYTASLRIQATKLVTF